MTTKSDTFQLETEDGTAVFCYRWLPEDVKAAVQIVHGGAEHAGRYERLAEQLTGVGYAVYAEDHRGHGRTATNAEALGDMGPANGLVHTCEDVIALSHHIQGAHPDTPLIILGHSIGSLITQRVLIENGGAYAAAVLSGSPSVDVLKDAEALVDAAIEDGGRGAPGDELQMQIFASFLEGLGEFRTPFDWLSRDEAEVDKYIADPLCGFALRIGAWRDIIDAAAQTTDIEAIKQIPTDLPVYIFSGEADPVHDLGAAVEQIAARYTEAGIERLTKRYYAAGRHEMFNEINREEVTGDLIEWLESVRGDQ